MANVKWSSFPSGGDMQVGDISVGLRGGLNFQFTFPSDGIKDANGNLLISWASVGATAVNNLTFTNSSSTFPVTIAPTGADGNIGVTISGKGSGVITLASNTILNTSSPTTALQAASKGYVDSLIPAIPISLANGGTGASLVASNGGIFFSNASTGAILSGTATANQVLLSGSSSAPAWSTATYPATTTINQILFSSAANTITGITAAANGVLVTSNTNVPSILAGSSVTGNILSSRAAAAPAWSSSTYADTYTVNNLLFASSTNTVTGLATANNGVLITSAGGVPSISSTLPSAVQANITQTGTIATGVWQGTAIDLAHGGTNANLTASNGGIFYSTASAGAILAGTATARQMLQSGASGAPSWSSATWPATTTINQILFSSSANVVGGITAANSAVLVSNSSGVPAFSGSMTNGQLIIGSTSATPSAATLTAGTGITITNGAASITIASTGGGFAQINQNTSSVTMASQTQYTINNGASLVTLTLPATAAVGDAFFIVGQSSGGWKVGQAASQKIHVVAQVTTTGTGGSLASTNQYDNVMIVCIVANTDFSVVHQVTAGLTIV